jgi:hypothetical protein
MSFHVTRGLLLPVPEVIRSYNDTYIPTGVVLSFGPVELVLAIALIVELVDAIIALKMITSTVYPCNGGAPSECV